ncbi:MAG: ABC transporter ATP-binding protein [Fimbriimonadaceae bacterium]
MSDLAISVRGLVKEYRIAHNQERHLRVTDAAWSALKALVRRPTYETFRALDDVSFDVRKGDVVGIIGRNGAGKSTLLKVLSRITEPTQGEIRLYGRVGSLLEVGTGFHPELTGRENIYLNGAILGMRKREIDRQFDAIVDFAEVQKFLDTPVKRYSSGMYVRLAFAVAAHLNPEILIVDEVLAVGDAQFQQKCLGKMQDVSRQEGRTVLFVSHNMGVVGALCSRAVVLCDGAIAFDGSVVEGVEEYTKSLFGGPLRRTLPSSHDVLLESLSVQNQETDTCLVPFLSPLDLTCAFRSQGPTPPIIPCFRWRDAKDRVISEVWGPEEGIDFRSYQGLFSFHLKVDSFNLLPGTYYLDVLLDDQSGRHLFESAPACRVEVLPSTLPEAPRAYDPRHGILRLCSSLSLKVAKSDPEVARRD